MKKPFYLSFVAIALLLTTAAFGQSPNPLYQHLPPTANHIYSIRLGQIIEKGELTGLLGSIPAGKDPNSQMAFQIIKDPASAGVDLSHEILIAQTTASGTGADTISFIQVLIPLTDSAKFRATFSAAMKDQRLHRIPGKGVTTSKGKAGIAWNDHLFVMTSASTESSNVITDSATVYMPGKEPHKAPTPKTAPSIHKSLAELSVEKSLAILAGYSGTIWTTDQRFLTGFATNEDMHAWSTRMDFVEMMGKMAKKFAAKSMAMQGKAFPDYSNLGQRPHPPVLSTFNFDNGRIVFHMTTFNKPEDAAMYQREFDRPINKDLLARVPNNGLLLGAATMHFNPSVLPDIMDKYNTRHMVDSMLGKKGLSISDIAGIFGGDIMVAVLGDTTATTDTTKKKINFYFVATLGDPAKMMEVAAKFAANNNAAADTSQMSKMMKLKDKLVVRDNLLVISGSQEKARQYFDNSDRRSTSLLADNTVQDLVVDLKTVSAFISSTMSNNPKIMVFARILERLDKLELKSDMPNGNNMNVTFQIVTGDPSTNSLKTLVGLMH